MTQPLLERCGLKLLRQKDYKKLCQREVLLTEMIHQSTSQEGDDGGLEFVIFSKDRALQLHGLLSSMLYHLKGLYRVRVLYCASTDMHQKAYEEVAGLMEDGLSVEWHREVDFRKDLIEVLHAGQCSRMCFLVDDIVFIRPVDFERLNGAILDQGILSLRLGRGIDFCYTKQKSMRQPVLTKVDGDENLLSFSWGDGQYDWGYPLSVDGHIFPRNEMIVAVESLDYRAPNSFEAALQLLNPLYARRKGYCFELPRMLNIPLNRVQDEKKNISADISPESLLKQWNDGLMLDYKKLESVSTRSVHQELDVIFCKRKNNEY